MRRGASIDQCRCLARAPVCRADQCEAESVCHLSACIQHAFCMIGVQQQPAAALLQARPSGPTAGTRRLACAAPSTTAPLMAGMARTEELLLGVVTAAAGLDATKTMDWQLRMAAWRVRGSAGQCWRFWALSSSMLRGLLRCMGCALCCGTGSKGIGLPAELITYR